MPYEHLKQTTNQDKQVSFCTYCGKPVRETILMQDSLFFKRSLPFLGTKRGPYCEETRYNPKDGKLQIRTRMVTECDDYYVDAFGIGDDIASPHYRSTYMSRWVDQ